MRARAEREGRPRIAVSKYVTERVQGDRCAAESDCRAVIPMMSPHPLTVTRQALWPDSRTSRAAARINELPHVGCRRGFVGTGRSVAPRSAAQIARTDARLDNPFSISSYRPNCCEIAPGEGQRVLDSNPGERTAIFTSLTSPR